MPTLDSHISIVMNSFDLSWHPDLPVSISNLFTVSLQCIFLNKCPNKCIFTMFNMNWSVFLCNTYANLYDQVPMLRWHRKPNIGLILRRRIYIPFSRHGLLRQVLSIVTCGRWYHTEVKPMIRCQTCSLARPLWTSFRRRRYEKKKTFWLIWGPFMKIPNIIMGGCFCMNFRRTPYSVKMFLFLQIRSIFYLHLLIF